MSVTRRDGAGGIVLTVHRTIESEIADLRQKLAGIEVARTVLLNARDEMLMNLRDLLNRQEELAVQSLSDHGEVDIQIQTVGVTT